MLAVLLCASGCAAQASPAVDLRPCDLPGLAERVYCGVHEVWEDRPANSGRRIPLRIVLLPARAAAPAPDPIVVLQGGPGASNVASAAAVARSPLRDRRHMLLVDLRGTGGSAPLDCPFQAGYDATGYLEDFLPLEGVRVCRDSLAARAKLTRYTTPQVVDDLAEVIEALGFRQVNLQGFSGGTRQVLALLRRHPELVRSALLEGPVPLDARLPMTFARDAQDALDSLLTDCLADSACGRAFPGAREEFGAVVRRLDSAPVSIDVVTREGKPARIRLTRAALGQVIRYMLYRPATAAAIPLTVHRAAMGDFERVGRAAVSVGVGGGLSLGFYLSNTCSEDLPWFMDTEGVAAARGTFLGDYRLRQQRGACRLWPRAELPADHLRPVRSPAPVLILVGARDPVTPARWGHEIARTLPNARVVVVPGGGHAFAGLEPAGCLTGLRGRFLDERSVAGLAVECVRSLRRPPFPVSE